MSTTRGTNESGGSNQTSPSRLYRNPDRGFVLGVCAGIADYFGIQPWVVRIGTVIALFMFPPPTLIGYFILALVLPKAPRRLYRSEAEGRFWRNVRLDPSRSFAELRHRFRGLEHRLGRMEAYVTSEAYRVENEINGLDR